MPTSLGPAEILVILVVALIVLGPKKLPEAGRQVGKAIAEVRKWSQGFQDEIKNVMEPEVKRPSYSEPQPGYQPPIPVIPTETWVNGRLERPQSDHGQPRRDLQSPSGRHAAHRPHRAPRRGRRPAVRRRRPSPSRPTNPRPRRSTLRVSACRSSTTSPSSAGA